MAEQVKLMEEAVEGSKVQVLGVGTPAQGHFKPMLKLCRKIAKHGIKVTFVNIQTIHDKFHVAVAAAADNTVVELASVPDPPVEDDKDDFFKLMSLKSSMPHSVKDLIQQINTSNPDEKIRFVIADVALAWILDVAEEMGAEPLLLSPASAAFCTLIYHVPKLLQDGILDINGTVEGEKITLSDDIPTWGKDEFPWSFPQDRRIQKSFLELVTDHGERKVNQDKLLLINTCYELESSACDMNLKSVPIGPLLESNASSCCNFYPEDASCLSWLDTKHPKSVIYVSFGSMAVVSQQQLEELAIGLELSGRTFLWVVRSDLANGSPVAYPDGFLERVSEIGMIVEWAPQENVLSHPSVACFLSHCGWNSTLEGLSNGVPFLCWPVFGDQFHNQNYICDKWETGLRVHPDGSGIRTRNEIKDKVDMLFCNDNLKANAMRLKEVCAKTISEGGSSYNNFERFIEYLRK